MACYKCPVRIRGQDYPSQTAAARALGVSKSTVCLALDRGAIDRVGLGRKVRPIATCVDGVWYRSQCQAAADTGLGYLNLSRSIREARARGKTSIMIKGHTITWRQTS